MESLRARGNAVTGIFVVIVVLSACASLSDLSLMRLLHAISSGETVDDARAEEIDSRQSTIGVIQLVVFLVCGIVFLMWFYRAHKNLKLGGLKRLEYTPGWTIGGFFVPFLNVVRPFQVMEEVWRGSATLATPQEEGYKRAPPSSMYVRSWWGLFLITSLLGNASGRLMAGAGNLEELVVAGWVTVVSDVVVIPAAIVALFLVRRVTDLQERARIRLQTDGSQYERVREIDVPVADRQTRSSGPPQDGLS